MVTHWSSSSNSCSSSSSSSPAVSQVISLDLRTALKEGEGVWEQPGYSDDGKLGKTEEIDYCTMLNRFDKIILEIKDSSRNLPQDIKVTGWAPAPRLDFSAR